MQYCLTKTFTIMANDYYSQLNEVLANSPKEKYMDLRVDWAFKYVFSIKENLLKFLNDILPPQIDDLEYLPNEIPVMSEKDKRSRLDVLCTSRDGKFLVEMQQKDEDDFDDRVAYYASSMVQNQVKRGDLLYKVKHVYVLCVAAYERRHISSTPKDKVLFNYYLEESDTHEEYINGKISYHFLELSRFQEDDWDKLMKNPERWCFLFKKMHKFATEEELPKDLHGFGGVVDTALKECLSEDQTMEYEKAKAFEYERLLSQLYGEKKGKAEEKKAIAKAMLTKGLDIKIVSECTGLTEEELNTIPLA